MAPLEICGAITELNPSDLELRFTHGIALEFMYGSNDLPKSRQS